LRNERCPVVAPAAERIPISQKNPAVTDPAMPGNVVEVAALSGRLAVRQGYLRKLLSRLLPTGALGVSVSLAAFAAQAAPTTDLLAGAVPQDVAAQLAGIRNAVSSATADAAGIAPGDPNIVKAWWGNWGGPGFGWRNGGWGNGGWGNGGWRNWHNGWGNGGWHNWHNFWHNW
jgi:rSAM-associated Gly-rich repeat protein